MYSFQGWGCMRRSGGRLQTKGLQVVTMRKDSLLTGIAGLVVEGDDCTYLVTNAGINRTILMCNVVVCQSA